MSVCKYRNQRVRIIDESNRKSFIGVSKTKKKYMKGLSFVTQFKIEFYYRLLVIEKCLEKCLALPQRHNHPHTFKVMMHETLTYILNLYSTSHNSKLISI